MFLLRIVLSIIQSSLYSHLPNNCDFFCNIYIFSDSTMRSIGSDTYSVFKFIIQFKLQLCNNLDDLNIFYLASKRRDTSFRAKGQVLTEREYRRGSDFAFAGERESSGSGEANERRYRDAAIRG